MSLTRSQPDASNASEHPFTREWICKGEESAMRFGAGIWLFGQFVDRYATDAYGPPVTTIEAIERAGAVGDLEVLDINYPFSDPDITVDDVQRALDAAGLSTWCITPH